MSVARAVMGQLDTRPASLRRYLSNPALFRAYLGVRLPLALIAGLKIEAIDEDNCAVSVPYGWRTTNPFQSTYFAALSMAAEMSTGALALVTARAADAPVSTLIVGLNAKFDKKATAKTTFRCGSGAQLRAAIERTLETGEPAKATAEAIGTAPDGTVVARFEFVWSFKRKSGPAAA